MKHSRMTAMSTLGENSAVENGCVARPRITSRQVSRLACGISKRAGVATSTEAAHALRMRQGEIDRHRAAEGAADQHERPQRQRVGERRR